MEKFESVEVLTLTNQQLADEQLLNEQLMQRAIKQAELALQEGEVAVGAVVIAPLNSLNNPKSPKTPNSLNNLKNSNNPKNPNSLKGLNCPGGSSNDWVVLAEAHNLTEQRHDATAHAELLAIQQASERLGDWRLQECTLVVTLEPCEMCAGAIKNAQAGRLIFGAFSPLNGGVFSINDILRNPPTAPSTSSANLQGEIEIVGGVLASPCSQLLKQSFPR
jgi:tRNA(adenine34) deaminase